MKNSTTTGQFWTLVITTIFVILNNVEVARAQQNNLEQGFTKIPLTYSFSPYDYQAGIQNWDLSQDSRGFIYVANNFGILEFDGTNWELYRIPNTTKTLSVFVNEDGKIYTGGQNQFGYFDHGENGKLEYFSLANQLPDSVSKVRNIWNIHKLQGNIIFNADEGIYVYDGIKTSYHSFQGGNGFTFLVEGKLYAFTKDNGMLIWNGLSFEKTAGGERFINKTIVGLVPSSRSGLLIFENNGQITSYDKGIFKSWVIHSSDFLERNLVNTVQLLNNNTIAIGTQNDGLLIINQDGKAITHLNNDKGLNSITVLSMHEDQYENLWVGLNNGITIVEQGSPFSVIDSSIGVTGTGYDAYFDGDRLYLGTNTGLYSQPANSSVIRTDKRYYSLIQGTAGQVYSIQELNDGIYIGHHRGAMKIYENKADMVYDSSGVWKIVPFPNDDSYLVGTYEGLLKFNPKNNSKIKLEGFNESARTFEFDNDSSLWLTHSYRGVYRITFAPSKNKLKSVDFFGTASGFPSTLLINAFPINGEIIFPAEYGIYSFNSQVGLFQNHTEFEDLLGTQTHISQLVEDLNNNLYYIIGNKTFGMLEQSSFSGYKKEENKFRRINKFLSDDLENITIIDYENILIGAKQGFIHYDPSLKRSRVSEFSAYIRSMELTTTSDSIIYHGGKLEDLDNWKLSENQNNIKFTYAAPYYDGLEDIQYRYYLENFETNWSEWSSSSVREYTNLPPGEFTFKVQALNIYGEESTISHFNFTIYPPWYKTTAAYFIYSLSLLLMFVIAIIALDKKHRKEREEIESSSQEKIQEKESQLKTVSQKSTQEIQKLRNEKLKAEVDHKNRELTSSTMHLLNKNEIMLGVKKDLEKIKNGDVTLQKEIKKIIKTIDGNIDEDQNWNQFTQHFNEVHGEFLDRLKEVHPDLTPQETKLAAYLRMNLTSKDIAQLSNISVRGVEVGRYRLRKKLELDSKTNLVKYVMDI